jgi:hypothetical protein
MVMVQTAELVLFHANDVKNVLPYFAVMASKLNRTDAILVLMPHECRVYVFVIMCVLSFAVPMLLSEAMSFADFREVAQPSHGKLILEVLNLLVKEKVGINLLHNLQSTDTEIVFLQWKK